MEFHTPEFIKKKLTRSRTDKIVAGVCGGLGAYYHIKPVMIRLAFIIFIFIDGRISLVLYLLFVVLIPEESGPSIVVDYKRKIKEFINEVRGEGQTVAEEIKSNKGWLHNNGDAIRIFLLVFVVIVTINVIATPFWVSYQIFEFITLAALVVIVFFVIKK